MSAHLGRPDGIPSDVENSAAIAVGPVNQGGVAHHGRVPLALAALSIVAVAGFLLYALLGNAIVRAAQGTVVPLPVLLGLAVVGGTASFFTPCSIVFAPTFLVMMGSAEDSRSKLLGRAMWVAFGILLFYALLGLVVGSVGAAIDGALLYLIPVLGVAFLLLGVLILTGRTGFMERLGQLNPALASYERTSASRPARSSSLLSLGILYGAGAHGCSLPIFLGIVLVPLAAGNILAAALTILVYGAALALFLLVTVALGRQAMPAKGRLWGQKVQQATGWLFAFLGVYLVLYFITSPP